MKFEVLNKSLYTNVAVEKKGYLEAMAGQIIRYDFIMEADSYITSATNEMKSADLSSSVDMYNKYITAQEYLTKGKVYFKSASTLCDIYPNGTKSFSKKLENVIAKIPSNVYGSSYNDHMNDCADMLRACRDLYDEMSSFTSLIAKGE